MFSFGGYRNPQKPHDYKRPGFRGFYSNQLESVAMQCSQENLHEELIAWADAIIFMHRPDWIESNWEKIKHKKIILRTIGQSRPDDETRVTIPKMQGLKIVRYSPEEQRITNFAGQDAIIRFYKDPDEFRDYNGEIPAVLSVSQSMKQRGQFCGYDIFNEVTHGLTRSLYGTQSKNPDLTPMDDPLWRGELTFEELKQAYRDHRVYFYTGTYPASYTMNFMEAIMTGIPIVAIGRSLADLKIHEGMDVYEVDKIIKNGVNGYISDNKEELRNYLNELLSNPKKARLIGEAGRKTAIELFGKNKIKREWEVFLNEL